jgi:DNA-binding NarL/FixJ family response regulator
MITVLIADDHPVVRSGVRSLLRGEANIRVAAEAKTAAEVLQQLGSRDFDVILLDVTLPDGSGVDLIPHVRRKSPSTQVVMFTNVPNEQSRALEAGAVAYLSKETPADVLIKTIEAAMKQPARKSESAIETSFPQYEQLSGRELEIMLKPIAGRRNKEIALELGISEKTVATHRARMLRKLGLADLRALMLYAVRNGLADWSS